MFGSLVEARIWEQFPVVLVTGSGMPDVATRAMLKHICTSATERRTQSRATLERWQAPLQAPPPFHCMGLVDWNPAGCDILLNYKFGNKKGCRESQACGLFISHRTCLCCLHPDFVPLPERRSFGIVAMNMAGCAIWHR